MSLLEARGIWLGARIGAADVDVLRDVSFTLERGETLGLVGESGAGKTMIGRLCSQLLPPGFSVSRGELVFAGEDLLRMAPERRRQLLGRAIAFIPQEPLTALNPVLTVGAQFDEHFRRLGIGSAAARREKAVASLAAVHLPQAATLLGKFAHQLSGGMCQRVLIALAFASDPALVIADEPTTALDVSTQVRIMALIREMQGRHGTAMILITHDLRLAAHVCDTMLVMYAGDVVESGPARRLLSDPVHPYAQSLLRASPSLSGPRRRLPTLPDHMPGLLEFGALPGCRFAPRCPVADPACTGAIPDLVTI
ncbi:MAG: ABC transporter ATP-binding protein, partial [Alphaproteobacteria bacterium]|nr:ABC transporter ATP-binding protein [Alphaproteobacteria bacterium]